MRDSSLDARPAADVLEAVVRLARPESRRDAARTLARALGADDLIILVHDAEVGAMLPAPGFPQTLPGGGDWHALLRACIAPGRYDAGVELPEGVSRSASVLSRDGLAVVLLDARREARLDELERYLPLLAFAFGAEQRARLAATQAEDARQAASRAQELASALDLARADASWLNAELRAEHQRKDYFLAMLAHELRNPLSPLVSSLDLLRLAAPEQPLLRERIEVMTRHTRQLTQLVDDLLDVSRVSRGRIELRRELLDLREVLREALEANHTALQARGHAVESAIAPDPITVEGDRVRLTQIFSNLVHNAAKYTPPGGRIRIASSRDPLHAIIEIQDNGIGIECEMLPRIFGLFHQVERGLAGTQGGLGIGLALARALVELHGGRIEAASAGPGQGSRFRVSLPLAEPAGAVAPPRHAARNAPARTLRVLAVDDNQDAADALAVIFKLLGHHAEVAYSSTAALQLACDSDPDLVVLDIGLPDFDGYDLARRLRRLLRPRTYFVALTGYGGEEQVRRAQDAGFDEHVIKPAPIEVLRGVASRAAERLAAGTLRGAPAQP